MKDERFENDRLENLLRKAHLPDASPELKQRITAEATKAWKQTAAETSWQVPLRRLLASAAAAVLIVWLTDYSSDRALDRWRSGESLAVEQSVIESEMMLEMPYDPFAVHLVTMGRKSSTIKLRDHFDAVRLIMDESQQNGDAISPVPSGGSSSLIPNEDDAGLYS